MSTFPQQFTKENEDAVLATNEGQAADLRNDGWMENTAFVAAEPEVKVTKPVVRHAKKK